MRMKKMTGFALATAAAGMFAMTAAAQTTAPASKVKCEGVNSCKGHSDCSGAGNGCKGLNECRGRGFKEMSKADCDKAKAEMKRK